MYRKDQGVLSEVHQAGVKGDLVLSVTGLTSFGLGPCPLLLSKQRKDPGFLGDQFPLLILVCSPDPLCSAPLLARVKPAGV